MDEREDTGIKEAWLNFFFTQLELFCFKSYLLTQSEATVQSHSIGFK
tara:strand:+ start:6892 stop:7032 length:141 start_codon:yes stop_codon:yes gene_type:complete